MAKNTKSTKRTRRAPPGIKEIKARYPHVARITAVGESGRATRVVIRCTEDGCKAEREIATQDAFQVCRCGPCQREFAKARRRKTPAAAPKPKSPKARKRGKRTTKPRARKRSAS